MRGLLWVLALLMLVVGACATLRPLEPLCGPDHLTDRSKCRMLAGEHGRP